MATDCLCKSLAVVDTHTGAENVLTRSRITDCCVCAVQVVHYSQHVSTYGKSYLKITLYQNGLICNHSTS